MGLGKGNPLDALRKTWAAEKARGYDFSDFEAALSLRTRPESVDPFGGKGKLEEIGGLFGQGLRSSQNEGSPLLQRCAEHYGNR